MLRLIKVLIIIAILIFIGLSAWFSFAMNREGSRLVRSKLKRMFHRPAQSGSSCLAARGRLSVRQHALK
jgi:hypothetical protein